LSERRRYGLQYGIVLVFQQILGKTTEKADLDIPERGLDLEWEEHTTRAALLNEAIRFSQ
jgi:hypothetical protein